MPVSVLDEDEDPLNDGTGLVPTVDVGCLELCAVRVERAEIELHAEDVTLVVAEGDDRVERVDVGDTVTVVDTVDVDVGEESILGVGASDTEETPEFDFTEDALKSGE